MNAIPLYTLRQAVNQDHVLMLGAIGDSSTTHLRLTLKNLHNHSIDVQIEPGTTFAPGNSDYQEMAVIRPTIVRLEPLDVRAVWINTACLQANRHAPESRVSRTRGYLHNLGLKEEDIAIIVQGSEDDELQLCLDDLERIARKLGYTPEKLREMTRTLEQMRWGPAPTIHMNYRLAPVAPEQEHVLRCITDAVERIDKQHIAQIDGQARKLAENLIDQFGRKKVITELATRGEQIDRFQANQYLATLDSGLTQNVFQHNGLRFQPGDGLDLTEFDSYNDPEWKTPPQLSSVVVQYAIWSVTDGYDLDKCCRRIKRTGHKAAVMGAGVRSLLREASRPESDDASTVRVLRRKLPMFAPARWRRVLAHVQPW